MDSPKKSSIVTITDSNFVIGVFLLLCSLRKKGVQSRIYVLGVNLTPDETALLEQFDDVHVRPGDTSNQRNPATRKGEALLLADGDDTHFVTLLDGDCLVTGDITPYLEPDAPGLYARMKTPDEDGAVFARRYGPDDVYGSIPRRVLETWKKDVGEKDTPAITNTVCGGNLTLSKEYMEFARLWQSQMLDILPAVRTREAHDPVSEAYSQLDESVLNSLLAFSQSAPPVFRGALDADTSAHVVHLGPNNPKPWVLWRKEKLKHFDSVVELVEWAEARSMQMPRIPWTFRRKNRPWVYLCAHLHAAWTSSRGFAGKFLKPLLRRIKR